MASNGTDDSYNVQFRLEHYKLFNRLPSSSRQLSAANKRFISDIRNNSALFSEVVADLQSEHEPVRLGSCKVLGEILDTPAELCEPQLTVRQISSVMGALINCLNSATTSVQATAALWSLKKRVLASHAEMKGCVLSILESCKRATTSIQSELASRPSYAVAASTLQLIARLYVEQKEVMQLHTEIWFALTLPYCCHSVSKLLRVNAEEIIELSIDHLLQRAENLRSIVVRESEGVIAQLTTVLHKQYDEGCKLFAIKFWGQLVTIMGSEIESISISNLYLSAMSKAFSKNYPSRQTAAFKSWKTLVENFSTEYLLRPVILKRVCVPLTKSNYTDEKASVEARLDCWWALVGKLGGEMMNHFTEVCKPLLQFCAETGTLATNRTRNLIAEARNSYSPKARTSDTLCKWCLAIVLQFLGQCERTVLPNVSLGEDQRMPLPHSVLQYSGKMLVQAFQQSYRYIQLSEDLLEQGWLNDILQAYQTLVGQIVHLIDAGVHENEGRQLARMIFSFISNTEVAPATVLDLVMPATKFSRSVLSSTSYSPPSVNSMTTTPALCMLEKVYDSCTKMKGLDEQRCCECLSLLINKGLPDGLGCYAFIERCTILVPSSEHLEGVVSSSLLAIASVAQSVCRKDGEVTDLDHVLHIFTELVSKFPLDVIGDLLAAISDLLENILRWQLYGEHEVKMKRLWEGMLDKLTAAEHIHCISTHTASSLLPAFLSSVKHPSLTELSIQMWTNVMRNHASDEDHRQFRLIMAQLKLPTHDCDDLPSTQDLPPVDSPPQELSPTPEKDLSLKSTLCVSPRSSLSNGITKKRLIPPNQPANTVKQGSTSNSLLLEQESLGLLNGLVTPEKRRRLAETSPPAPVTSSVPPKSPSKKATTKHLICLDREVTPPITEVTNAVMDEVEQSQVISDCEDNSHSGSQQISDTVSSGADGRNTPQQHIKSRSTFTHPPALPLTGPAPATSPPLDDLTPPNLRLSSDLSRCHIKMEKNDRLNQVFESQQNSCSQATSSRVLRDNRKKTYTGGSQASQGSPTELSQKSILKKLVKAPVNDRHCPSQALISMVRNVSVRLVRCAKVKVVPASQSESQDCQSDPTSDIFDGILTNDSFFEGDKDASSISHTVPRQSPTFSLDGSQSAPQITPPHVVPHSSKPLTSSQPASSQSETSSQLEITQQFSISPNQSTETPLLEHMISTQSPTNPVNKPPLESSNQSTETTVSEHVVSTQSPTNPVNKPPLESSNQSTETTVSEHVISTQSPTNPINKPPLESSNQSTETPVSEQVISTRNPINPVDEEPVESFSNQFTETPVLENVILLQNLTNPVDKEPVVKQTREPSAHVENATISPQCSTENLLVPMDSSPAATSTDCNKLDVSSNSSPRPLQRSAEDLPTEDVITIVGVSGNESSHADRDTKSTPDDDITGSQFDEEMEIPTQTAMESPPTVSTSQPATDKLVHHVATTVQSTLAVQPAKENGGEMTPLRPGSHSKSRRIDVTVSSSPTGARIQTKTLLKMNSRSSQILAKAMSGRNNQSSPGGMSGVNTAPATPRSSKLSSEARELDCTLIYSPTTGSILKRKYVRSPADYPSKRVKFQLPEMLSQQQTDSEADIFSTNSGNDVNTESSTSNDDSQPTAATSRDPPIASEYTDCTVPIDDMVVHLTKPIWQGNLKQCLISQGLTTVGHMAQLTEADVLLLPISQPKLSTALKAFKKSGATKNRAAKVNVGPSKGQMERIAKLVADASLTDADLGRMVRDVFTVKKDS